MSCPVSILISMLRFLVKNLVMLARRRQLGEAAVLGRFWLVDIGRDARQPRVTHDIVDFDAIGRFTSKDTINET